MPRSQNDIIELGFVVETNGVQAISRVFVTMVSVGGNSDKDWLNNLATDFWDQVGGFMSGQATFSCLTMRNVTTGERVVTHPMLTGTLEDNHPAHGVVRINLYADPVAPDTKRYRGAFHISGTAEPESVNGLIGREDDYDGIRNWFQTDRIVSGGTSRALVRHDRTPKPSPTRDYHYGTIQHATVKSQIMGLNSRRSKLLCGAA